MLLRGSFFRAAHKTRNMWYSKASNADITDKNEDKNVIVDCRSDTVSKPCMKMRKAIFEAEVGDDMMKEDPTVIKIEKYSAELLGTEASLFVSSGTMGNLISTMVHCRERGGELYLGEDAHIMLLEQGGTAHIAGVSTSPIPNNPDGTFSLETMRKRLRNPRDVHHPISRMIAVENTMNGKVVPISWLKEVVKFGKEHDLKVHMDGARVWHAAVATKTSVKELVEGFDSVTFCLSKMGAPVGSILCGSKEFIFHARRARKVLGGAMRQVGVLAAAGLVVLDDLPRKLAEDHRRAKSMMNMVNSLGSDIFRVDPLDGQTNMVWIEVKDTGSVNAMKFAQRIGRVEDEHEDDQARVLAWEILPNKIRVCYHINITDELAEAAERKVRYVIKKMDTKFGI